MVFAWVLCVEEGLYRVNAKWMLVCDEMNAVWVWG
jgi:hypothetical protein